MVALVLLDKRSESRVDQVVVVAGRVVLLRVALVIRLQFLLVRVTRAVLAHHHLQPVTLRGVVAVLVLLVNNLQETLAVLVALAQHPHSAVHP